MKTFCFTVDDNIRFLKEITERKYNSIFAHPYLAMYKRLHETFDLQVQLNLFYWMEGFDLSQMGDQYRKEWEENAHWLKLSFHSDYENVEPYKTSGYEEVYTHCKQVNDYNVGLPGTDMTWGFADEEVIVDASLNCIYTAQKDAPNLFLYQFSAGELRYSRDYGKLDPARGWFSASLPGRRHPKTDIHTHWDAPAGTSSVLTVMASAPTDASRVASIHKFADGVISGCDIVMEDGQKLSFRFAPETVDMNGCDARVILTAGDTSVIMNNVKNSVFRNGIHEADILSPVAFEWKEEDGYAYPSYIY